MMEQISSWIAPIATTIAACMTAANLGSRVTGWGFVVFTVGSLAWTAYGLATGQMNLVWQNLFLTAVNAVGIWRWLGRQARVEEGARTAAHASEHTPGEALFPISALGRAPVLCGQEQVGHCIDAMAGRRSGKLDYIVVSEGGVAGVGERLRRLPWGDAHVEDETVLVHFSRGRFEGLEELSRDQWPGR